MAKEAIKVSGERTGELGKVDGRETGAEKEAGVEKVGTPQRAAERPINHLDSSKEEENQEKERAESQMEKVVRRRERGGNGKGGGPLQGYCNFCGAW